MTSCLSWARPFALPCDTGGRTGSRALQGGKRSGASKDDSCRASFRICFQGLEELLFHEKKWEKYRDPCQSPERFRANVRVIRRERARHAGGHRENYDRAMRAPPTMRSYDLDGDRRLDMQREFVVVTRRPKLDVVPALADAAELIGKPAREMLVGWIEGSSELSAQWQRYLAGSPFAVETKWDDVVSSIRKFLEMGGLI